MFEPICVGGVYGRDRRSLCVRPIEFDDNEQSRRHRQRDYELYDTRNIRKELNQPNRIHEKQQQKTQTN